MNKGLNGKGAWDQEIEGLLYQDMIRVCKARDVTPFQRNVTPFGEG